MFARRIHVCHDLNHDKKIKGQSQFQSLELLQYIVWVRRIIFRFLACLCRFILSTFLL